MNRSICGKLFDCPLANNTPLYIIDGKLYCGKCGSASPHICCYHCQIDDGRYCLSNTKKILCETMKDRNVIQEIMLARLDGEQ